MKLTAIFAAAAILFLGVPAPSAAQNPPTSTKSFEDRRSDLKARRDANRRARERAEETCDLELYRLGVEELEQIVRDLIQLGAEMGRNDTAFYWDAHLESVDAKKTLATLKEVCRKNATQPGGDIGAVQSTAPATQPPPGFENLWSEAAAAFHAHYSFAMNCDLNGMRAQRAKLERFTREARDLASKLRQRAAKGKASQADADAATLYEKAIEALWNAARLQPPLNCPRIEPPPPPQPPQPPQPPKGGSQDCPAPGTPGGSAPGKTPPEHGMRFTPPDERSERMLAAHNRARADAGVPPLTWDRELAVGAADYAAQMSTVGRVHAPREGRKCIRENLLQSLRGGRSPEQMVGVWVAEKRNFVPGTFPNVSLTGNWSDVGHYTQVIWQSTARIGCAVHSDARYDWLVCRYSPPGNVDGRPVM